jgi:hypothetical protein
VFFNKNGDGNDNGNIQTKPKKSKKEDGQEGKL